MEFKNGYKVVYEVAADGQRTFYATRSNIYPPRDADGNIVKNEDNIVLATFDDADYAGRIIYEYEGNFYVSEQNKTPKYNEDGTPADERITGFEAVLVESDDADSGEESDDGAEEGIATAAEEPKTPEDEEPEDEEPDVTGDEDEDEEV